MQSNNNNNIPKKVLVAVGYQPYPALFGGAVDVWERILGLKKMGCIVHLVFTEKKAPTPEELSYIKQYVDEVYFVKRKNHWSQVFSTLPLQVLSRKGLKKVQLAKKHYDWVIAEGEYCVQVVENPTLSYDKLIVRVHNDEAHYFAQLKKSVLDKKKKAYYTIEIPKIKKYSLESLSKADRLWYISAEEYKKSNFIEKSIFLPVPVNDAQMPYTWVPEEKVLFVGSFFMPNNIYALDWYLENVHLHLVDRENYEFVVVGAVKTEQEKLFFQKKYQGIEKMSLYFNQEDLAPFYKKAKVFVNPMHHGSGVKIKTIMALNNGLPLVSTTIGAEGIGLDHSMYWLADHKEDFLQSLLEIFSVEEQILKTKVCNAQTHLQNNHYLKILERELYEF